MKTGIPQHVKNPKNNINYQIYTSANTQYAPMRTLSKNKECKY